MSKLWVRLSLAFALVAVLGVVAVGVVTRRQVEQRFRRFVARSFVAEWSEDSAATLASRLGELYEAQGGWENLADLLDQARPPAGRPNAAASGRWRMQRALWPIVVADEDGDVVYSGVPRPPALRLSPEEIDRAEPIEWEGTTVGYVVVHPPEHGPLPAEAQVFLDQVRTALLRGGLIAAALGAVVGLVIARGLASPLSRLAAAARRISHGHLDERVTVEGAEEIANLARAFNEMATGLEQARVLRNNMVADIAHELRTPLSVIQGNLRAILDDVYPLEKSEIAGVYDETLMLGRLVDDLRQLADAEAGELRIRLQPTDLREVVGNASGIFAEPARDAGVTLDTAISADLPAVPADPDRTRQVLNNLLANALRHTPQGGQVRIEAGPVGLEGARVRVSVTDSGPGIPEENLEHVFDRFWRADDSRSRRKGGSGLGLAIAKHLVEAQGGTIGVESKTGEGSTFWFELPVAPS